MNTKPKSQTVSVRCFVTLFVAGTLLSSCTSPNDNRAPVHVIVGFDTSASYSPHLAESAQLCLRLASGLNPCDRLTLFRVDRSASEFYDGTVPESSDTLQGVLVRELSAKSSSQGTYPDAFWRESVRSTASAGDCSVILFSDGDVDDAGAGTTARTRRVAEALAGNRRVKHVCILGASRENWAALRSDFAPLGDRLVLCTASDLSSDTVRRCLPGDH